MSVLLPVADDVRPQLPTKTEAEQLSKPSVTVTVPEGVPDPGLTGATVHATVYGPPPIDGSGESSVIVVVVFALLTTWLKTGDVLPLKLEFAE